MALDLEEQEQLDEVKAWWRTNGTLVTSVIAALAISLAGWQAWRWVQHTRSVESGALYENLVKAVQAGDAKAVRDAGGALAENHAGMMYASMGALVTARFHADRGDVKNAKAQLQWVTERSASPEFRDLARLRMAALLLDEKAHDEALAQLEAPPGVAFVSQFAALRGDIETDRNRPEQAKSAYQQAIEKAGKTDQALIEGVRMRLEALGG